MIRLEKREVQFKTLLLRHLEHLEPVATVRIQEDTPTATVIDNATVTDCTLDPTVTITLSSRRLKTKEITITLTRDSTWLKNIEAESLSDAREVQDKYYKALGLSKDDSTDEGRAYWSLWR